MWIAALLLLAVNVASSALAGWPARTAYKPLLLLNGVFMLSVLFRGQRRREDPDSGSGGTIGRRWCAVVAGASVLVYLPTLGINIAHHDWTHRHIAAALTDWAAVTRLFTVPQPDGMYRPLAFLSFWLDYRLFGDALWAYHLQSIALHALTAVLAGFLALRCGTGVKAARVAGLLFAAWAVHFEAVLWPAARFDLLAAALASLSLLCFFEFSRRRGAAAMLWAASSVALFALAVLTKETAYSLILIVPVLMALVVRPPNRTKAALFLLAMGAAVASLLLVRWHLYGGMGGYAYAGAQGSVAPFKSAYSLVVNSLALATFGVNAAAPKLVLLGWAAAVPVFAILYRGGTARSGTFALLTLLAAVPVAPVIGWINPAMVHTRHLYWPSLWLVLLFAPALTRMRQASWAIAAFVVLQAAGGMLNVDVYRRTLSLAGASAVRVAAEAEVRGAGRIELVEIPEMPSGVLYFRPELEERVRRAAPGRTVVLCDMAAGCAAPGEGALRYAWDGSAGLVPLTPRR